MFYWPLLKKHAAQIPAQLIQGPLFYPSNDKDRISIASTSKERVAISMLVPPHLWWKVNSLKDGENVAVTYCEVPLPDSPFCYANQLVSIGQAAQN